MLTDKQQAELQRLIEDGQGARFYSWAAWDRVREKVMELDHHECVRCRRAGRYSPAVLVHHVKHLEDRPDLATEIYDPQTKERQLVSLCRACHELEHPERLAFRPPKEPVTEERWD